MAAQPLYFTVYETADHARDGHWTNAPGDPFMILGDVIPQWHPVYAIRIRLKPDHPGNRYSVRG